MTENFGQSHQPKSRPSGTHPAMDDLPVGQHGLVGPALVPGPDGQGPELVHPLRVVAEVQQHLDIVGDGQHAHQPGQGGGTENNEAGKKRERAESGRGKECMASRKYTPGGLLLFTKSDII